jgi:ketosteroid isomerase-like protein
LDWIEPWETYQPNIEQIIDLGDRVVVLGRDHGRIKRADHNIEGPKGLVLYHFDAGRVTRVEYYFDRDQGVRAVGVIHNAALAPWTTSQRLVQTARACAHRPERE